MQSSLHGNLEGPLFLGLDLSTQQLKVVVLHAENSRSGALGLHSTFAVHFDHDLPQYRTRGGVHAEGQGSHQAGPLCTRGTVTSPVLMWVQALELVLDRMLESQFPFDRVQSIGGSAQQHGSVYWSEHGRQALDALVDEANATELNKMPLVDLFQDGFTIPASPIWQDTSTGQQCRQLEDFMSAKATIQSQSAQHDDAMDVFPNVSSKQPTFSSGLSQGEALMANLTGSRAFERFTASQILKIAQTTPDLFQQTVRISLVSSFLASLLVGRFASIDIADGSGMNLLDISTKTWDPYLTELISTVAVASYSSDGGTSVSWDNVIERCDHRQRQQHYQQQQTGEEQDEVQDNLLTRMLGPVDASGRAIQGTVAPWFVRRYGFRPATKVISFTGDNPATALAMHMHPGDAIVSLGTSDTVVFYASAAAVAATAAYSGGGKDGDGSGGGAPVPCPSPSLSGGLDNHKAIQCGQGRQEQRQQLLQGLNHNAATSILCHPLDPLGFLTLYCAKNGSLARERVRDEYADGRWEFMDELLLAALERRKQTSRSSSKTVSRLLDKSASVSFSSAETAKDEAREEITDDDKVCQRQRVGFYYFDREIWPPVQGVYRFEDGRAVPEFTGADEMEIRQHNVLAICEAQLLAMRVRAMAMKEKSSDNPPPDQSFALKRRDALGQNNSGTTADHGAVSRILATGGGSKSKALLQLMAHVFNVPVVHKSEDGWAGSAAWGAARKAYLGEQMDDNDAFYSSMSSADEQGNDDEPVYYPDPVHADYYAWVTRQFTALECRLEEQQDNKAS